MDILALKVEIIKQSLNERRFWRSIFVGVIVALIGWIATSYKTADNILLILAVAVLMITICVLIAITFAIKYELRNMKNLEKD